MKSTLTYICLGVGYLVVLACTALAQDGLQRLPKEFDMPFTATTLEEAQQWQSEARKKLFGYVEALCPRKSVEELPLDVKIESTEERDAYRNDHACTNPDVAGEQLIPPSPHFDVADIPEEDFEKCRQLWLEGKEAE